MRDGPSHSRSMTIDTDHPFFDRFDKIGKCWIWRGAQHDGVGRMKSRGKRIDPRRRAYEIAFGPIPQGKGVGSNCGERLCGRPEHLKLKNVRGKPSPDYGWFWNQVKKPEGGCWISGKPYMEFELRIRPAHWIAYRITRGRVPRGCFVTQRCETDRCVKPAHLDLARLRAPNK